MHNSIHVCKTCIKTYDFSFYCIAVAVLKKYYDMLLESFSDDHVATVNKLNGIIAVNKQFLNEIISMTDHKKANVRILNGIICAIKRDNDVLGFCEVFKALISVRKRFTIEMFEFEAGKKLECIHYAIDAMYRKALLPYSTHCRVSTYLSCYSYAMLTSNIKFIIQQILN